MLLGQFILLFLNWGSMNFSLAQVEAAACLCMVAECLWKTCCHLSKKHASLGSCTVMQVVDVTFFF